jgi:hypothetical protein
VGRDRAPERPKRVCGLTAVSVDGDLAEVRELRDDSCESGGDAVAAALAGETEAVEVNGGDSLLQACSRAGLFFVEILMIV